MYILKIFFEFIKNYKLTVIFYILFTILAFPLEAIIIPQIYSHFFEILNINTKKEVFLKYLGLITGLLVIVNMSNSITTYMESYLIPEMNGYVINYIFRNLLIKHENSFSDIELGKLISRLSTIPHYLKDFVSEFCVWIFPRLLTIFIINVYFFYLNWKLGALSVFLLLLFFYFNYTFFMSCSPLSTQKHNLFEHKNQYTVDKLSNSYTIYSTGSLNKEISAYENNTRKYTSKFKENLLCLNKATIVTSILVIIIFVAINSMGTYLFMTKHLSFTNLIALFITVIYYTPCIVTINSTMPGFIQYYGSLTAVDNFIQELYDTNNIKLTASEKPLLKINKGTINIKNLNFGYSPDNQLFQNFNLEIKNNEKLAIIGSSGNGKSTLIKLIMGYYNVPDGTIFIDNIDINNYNLNDLRKQISYVNQNSKLFNLSIIENIQYGNDLTRDEIIKLCDKLKIDSIFKNLKDGLDTNAGIEGNNLSGGQKQLIHILRCIGTKNKIIILDEPTAAIDKNNTVNIINVINELSKNNTLLLISHDESILSFVDRIITLDAGKIIDDKYIGSEY